jgi:hypothetical protein
VKQTNIGQKRREKKLRRKRRVEKQVIGRAKWVKQRAARDEEFRKKWASLTLQERFEWMKAEGWL